MLKGLATWLKGLIHQPEPTAVPHADVPALILLGTDYDEFTDHAVDWMKEVLNKINLECPYLVQLHDRTLSKADVRIAMGSTDVPGRIEVFCGHGDYHALLGPPRSPASDVVIDDVRFSVIYDTTMVPRKPGSLIAFSCRSARILGRAYGTFLGKGFIGFDDDMPLDFSSDFMEQLENIFHSIVIDILTEGRVIPRHKEALKNLYDQAIVFFLDGEGRNVPNNFLFQLFLAEHRRCISLYSTHIFES